MYASNGAKLLQWNRNVRCHESRLDLNFDVG